MPSPRWLPGFGDFDRTPIPELTRGMALECFGQIRLPDGRVLWQMWRSPNEQLDLSSQRLDVVYA